MVPKDSITLATLGGRMTKLVCDQSQMVALTRSLAAQFFSCFSCQHTEPISGAGARRLYRLTLIFCDGGTASCVTRC